MCLQAMRFKERRVYGGKELLNLDPSVSALRYCSSQLFPKTAQSSVFSESQICPFLVKGSDVTDFLILTNSPAPVQMERNPQTNTPLVLAEHQPGMWVRIWLRPALLILHPPGPNLPSEFPSPLEGALWHVCNTLGQWSSSREVSKDCTLKLFKVDSGEISQNVKTARFPCRLSPVYTWHKFIEHNVQTASYLHQIPFLFRCHHDLSPVLSHSHSWPKLGWNCLRAELTRPPCKVAEAVQSFKLIPWNPHKMPLKIFHLEKRNFAVH